MLFILIFVCLITAINAQNIDPKNKDYQISYSSDREGYANIFISNSKGNYYKRITNSTLRNGYPSYSPDGKKISFYGYEDEGKTWSIFVMDRDGSNQKRLTHKKYVFDTMPRWSFDGEYIVFSRASSDWKTNEIIFMKSDGSKQKVIPDIEGLTPSFTKEGNIIYYTYWDKTGEIMLADRNGKILKQYTNNNFLDAKPDISPDGKKILFASERDGNSEIYIMDIDGNNVKRLTNHPDQDGEPKWSPDGSKILFVSKRDGNYEIYMMDADGSNLRNVTNNKSSDIQPTWIVPIRR